MDTDFAAVPDWFSWENSGGGVAVADIDGDGRLDLVVLSVDQATGGPNSGYYRVGYGADDELTVDRWSAWMPIPGWFSWQNEGAGIAVADVGGDGALDLVVFMIDAPDGPNAGYCRVGRALDATEAVTGVGRPGPRSRTGSAGRTRARTSLSRTSTATAISIWRC